MHCCISFSDESFWSNTWDFVGSNNSTCFCQCDNVPLQSGTEVNPWFYAAPVVIGVFSIRMEVYVMHRING